MPRGLGEKGWWLLGIAGAIVVIGYLFFAAPEKTPNTPAGGAPSEETR